MAFPTRGTAKAPKSPESFISLQNRNDAARILQSYEKLSWYSFQRGEVSVPLSRRSLTVALAKGGESP